MPRTSFIILSLPTNASPIIKKKFKYSILITFIVTSVVFLAFLLRKMLTNTLMAEDIEHLSHDEYQVLRKE